MLFIFYQNKKVYSYLCLKSVSDIPTANPESCHFSPSHPTLNLSHEYLSLEPLQWPRPLFLLCHLRSVKSQSNHVSPPLQTFLWLTTQDKSETYNSQKEGYMFWLLMTFLSSRHPLLFLTPFTATAWTSLPCLNHAVTLTHCISVDTVASSGTTILLRVSAHLPPHQWDLPCLLPKSVLSPYLILLYFSSCHLYLTYHIFYMFFKICLLVFLLRICVMRRYVLLSVVSTTRSQNSAWHVERPL